MAKVVEIAEKFIHIISEEYRENVLAACWAHDVIEDTRQTFNDVKSALGEEIANIVYDVTNELGKNRKERAIKTYPKIAPNFIAIFVKMCDRTTNTIESKKNKHGMYNKYRGEYSMFREYLYNPMHGFDELWKFMDDLNSD